MKIIKADRVYKAGLPNIELLRGHLAELAFTEISSHEYSRSGFVPTPGSPSAELVTFLPNGYSFALRYDEKIIPAASVKAEVARLAAGVDPKPGRKQLREMRDDVFAAMVERALHRTTIVSCFYHPASETLLVCTVSQKLADLVTSNLVKVVGSIKTTTIHIAELKHGLTTKLKNQLFTGDHQFPGFELPGSFWLKSAGEKVSIELEAGDSDGPLSEALGAGLQVDALRLTRGIVSFKLSSDFVFRGISFVDSEEEPDDDDAWPGEANLQLLEMADTVQALCDLMGYVEPTNEG